MYTSQIFLVLAAATAATPVLAQPLRLSNYPRDEQLLARDLIIDMLAREIMQQQPAVPHIPAAQMIPQVHVVSQQSSPQTTKPPLNKSQDHLQKIGQGSQVVSLHAHPMSAKMHTQNQHQGGVKASEKLSTQRQKGMHGGFKGHGQHSQHHNGSMGKSNHEHGHRKGSHPKQHHHDGGKHAMTGKLKGQAGQNASPKNMVSSKAAATQATVIKSAGKITRRDVARALIELAARSLEDLD